MIDFALLVDLAKQTKPETQMMTRINVLEFFGNDSIVEVESYKHQAGEAPSTKLQAPSHRGGRAGIKKLQAREACDKLSHDNMSFSIYPAPTPATCQL